jgi:DnaJ family protein C protein 13
MCTTKSLETQHRLLKLLAVILGNSDKSGFAEIPENAEQLLNIESISLLCQFVAWAHTDRSQIISNSLSRALSLGTKNTLLTDGSDITAAAEQSAQVSSDMSCPPVWYVASTAKIPPPPEKVRGPFRLSNLHQMIDSGSLSPYDLVTTAHVEEYDADDHSDLIDETQIDTGKWKRLDSVWQLRWTLCTDAGSTVIFAPTDVARLALQALTRVVDLHKSVDNRGVPYMPIPISKRILSTRAPNNDANPLATLCQALLCNNADLVDQAADLVYKITRQNDRAIQKLYLTGIFFFACCYQGNNFKGIAKLLHATHLEQHFRSGFSAAAGQDEIPLKERSILGQLLPEGLLHILVNYGPERFADIFVGGADTPEVIWTFEMRKHLIEMTRQHLGDFPLRLFQNNGTEYEYCPMPGVAYPRLEKEVFCHNYYLCNLCDDARFPDWPMAEPAEVFRSCLEHFKKFLSEDNGSNEDAQDRARQILELKIGDSIKELRKAYRRLARVYHPDKNPSGRDMFESIQASYELLQPLLEGGGKIAPFDGTSDPNHNADAHDGLSFRFSMKNIQILIQAQLLICRRYEKEMRRYKYPAYQVLLSCLKLPSSYYEMLENENDDRILKSSFLKGEVADLIQMTVELVFRTCLVSPLNAEELVLEEGVPCLTSLLSFTISSLRAVKKSGQRSGTSTILSRIIRFTVQTLSGLMYYESGRSAVKSMDKQDSIFFDLRRCIDGTLNINVQPSDDEDQTKAFASDCVANMARDSTLQEKLARSGIIWPLIRAILTFDVTAEPEGSGADGQDVLSTINIPAKNSVRALGMLSGSIKDSPVRADILSALQVLMTDPVALMLRNQRSDEILRIVNSNTETATIIWKSSMQKHLENFVECVEAKRSFTMYPTIEEELRVVSNFGYEELKREVKVGGVYLRIFNKQGKEALGKIPNPVAFCVAICRYLAFSLNRSKLVQDLASFGLPAEQNTGCLVESEAFLLVVTSLVALCRVDGIVTSAIEESPSLVVSLFLSLLNVPEELEVSPSCCFHKIC